MKTVSLLLLALFTGTPLAQAQSITVQGKVTDSAGQAVSGSTTQFRVQILTPTTERCVLFDETHTVDLSSSYGLFSINLNNGSGTRNLPTTYSLEDTLTNRAGFAVNSTYCASGSGTVVYNPTATDNRKIVIQFRDPATMTGWETIPEMDLNPVPYAVDSRSVGGYAVTSLLRVANAGTPGAAATLTSADMTELQALVGGTSSRYMTASTGAGAQLPSVSGNPSTPAAGSVWFDSSTGNMKYYDGTTVQTLGTSSASGDITAVNVGTGLTGGGLSGAVTVSLDTSGVSANTYGSGTAVPVLTVDAYGRITAASTTAISGVLPSGTSGQFLKSGGGTSWSSASITLADLKSTIGGVALFSSPGCTAAQTLYWDSGTDTIRCQNIAINASAITAGQLAVANGGTGAATAGQNFVFAGPATGGAGAPAFRALTAADLPASANVWQDGGSGKLYYNGGNVGIGSNDPAVKLDVVGALQLSGTDSAGFVTPAGSTVPTKIAVPPYSPGAFGQIMAMGLPSSAPVSSRVLTLFDARTGAHQPSLMLLSPNESEFMGFSWDGTNTLGSLSSSQHLGFKVAGNAEALRIETSGFVGIGTTAPTNFLDVLGAPTDDLTMAVLRSTGSVGSGLELNAKGLGGQRYSLISTAASADSGAGKFAVYDSSNDVYRLTVDASGNVGIGTYSPTALLHLKAGTATANTAPLKFTAGTNLTAPEDGAMEYNGTTYFLTVGSTRYAIPLAGGSPSYSTVSAGAGAVGTPSYTFSGDPNTGFFSSAADTIGVAANGVKVFDFSSAGLVSPTTGGAAVSSANGSAAAPTFSFAGDADTGWYRAAADTLAAATGGVERVRIDSSGNIGVGTTSAQGKIHVVPTLAGGTGLVLDKYNNTEGGELVFNDNTNSWANDINLGDFRFNMMGGNFGSFVSTPLIIKNSGNVGIGTTQPGTKLQVNSEITAFASSGIPRLTSRSAQAAGYAPAFLGLTRQDVNGGPTPDNQGIGEIRFEGISTTSTYVTPATIIATGGVNSANGIPGTLIFSTDAADGNNVSERMRIQPNGMVGIGTGTPGARLQVSYSGSAASRYVRLVEEAVDQGRSSYFRSDDNGSVNPITMENLDSTAAMTQYVGLRTRMSYTGGANAAVTSSEIRAQKEQEWTSTASTRDSALTFHTTQDSNSNERLRIRSDGNVGVGTTSPGQKLSVEGGGYFTGWTGFGTRNPLAWIHMQDSNPSMIFERVADNANGSFFTIRKARGASVSTPTDVQTGDVIGNIVFSAYRNGGFQSSGANSSIRIMGYVDGTVSGNSVPAGLWLNTTGPGETTSSTRLAITGDGRIGVGTTNPLGKMTVLSGNYGDTVSDYHSLDLYTTQAQAADLGGTIGLGGLDGGNTGSYISYGVIGGRQESNNMNNGYLQFSTRTNGGFAAERMRITSTGRVGIGTTNPNYQLEVIGDIRASGNLIANATTYSSDLRLKKEVAPLEGALARLSRIRGVSYLWRSEEFPERHFSDRRQVGLIAQEVEQQYPELVVTDAQGFKSVNYPAFVAPLIEAVRELAEKLVGTDTRVQALEAKNAAKERELASVKAQNEAITAYLCAKDPKAPFCAKK